MRVEGDLDLATTPLVRDALADAPSGARVVLDLSACTFLDSSAVQLFATAARDAEQAGGSLAVVAPDPAVARVLEITRMDTILEVHRSLETAL